MGSVTTVLVFGPRDAGPNAVSSFHVIGEIFDKVHPEGATETLSYVQSILVPAGGATMVELKTQVPGTYDHSLGGWQKGAARPKVFQSIQQGSHDGGGH